MIMYVIMSEYVCDYAISFVANKLVHNGVLAILACADFHVFFLIFTF